MSVCLNELLGRPLIQIYQDSLQFRFSTDSILLAHFASVNAKVKKIIDLGTGNAPIPLYLSLRTKALITGVEIQEGAYDLAIKSVELNHLEDQISLINADLVNISNTIGKNTFNLVTCNPPFFKKGSSIVNPSDAKSIARHEITATLADIVHEARELLNSNGYFAMVHRPDRLIEIIECLKSNRLEPKRLQFVYPKKNAECNHILIEAQKDGASGGLRILEPLFIYNEDGSWTEEALKIFNYMG